MIVQKDKTDAQREGYVTALCEHSDAGNSLTEALEMAREKYPYQQERVVRIEYNGEWHLFKVQSECLDQSEDYAVGTLLVAPSRRGRPQYNKAFCYIDGFSSDALRQLADLLDNPLENYVEPAELKPVEA
jgi:hypothetical protein